MKCMLKNFDLCIQNVCICLLEKWDITIDDSFCTTQILSNNMISRMTTSLSLIPPVFMSHEAKH